MQKTFVCKVLPQDQQPALGVPRDFGMTAVALLPSRTVNRVLSAHGAARTDQSCQCIVQLCSMQHVPCISRYNSLSFCVSFYVSFYLIYVHVIARAQCTALQCGRKVRCRFMPVWSAQVVALAIGQGSTLW